MNNLDKRGPITRGIEETKLWEASPFIQGLASGTKGALMAAPIAAAVQAMRGKDPIIGGLLAALSTGAIVGAAKALEQTVKNREAEGTLRYHVEQLKSREPLIFLPPPNQFGQLFSRLHNAAHVRILRRVPSKD